MKVSPKNQFGKLNIVKYYIENVQTNLDTAKSYLDIVTNIFEIISKICLFIASQQYQQLIYLDLTFLI